MKKRQGRISGSALLGIVFSVLVVLFFVGIIILYHAMLTIRTQEKIVKSCELSAAATAEQIDKYLSVGINTMKMECYSLNNMIRGGKSHEEILNFMLNQSATIQSVTDEYSTGIYGYIEGEYLDGNKWTPDAGYVPTERQWYIEARANIGRVAVVDPYVDAMTNTVMLTLSKTLCDAKSVAAMDFSLERLQDIVEEFAVGGQTRHGGRA